MENTNESKPVKRNYYKWFFWAVMIFIAVLAFAGWRNIQWNLNQRHTACEDSVQYHPAINLGSNDSISTEGYYSAVGGKKFKTKDDADKYCQTY